MSQVLVSVSSASVSGMCFHLNLLTVDQKAFRVCLDDNAFNVTAFYFPKKSCRLLKAHIGKHLDTDFSHSTHGAKAKPSSPFEGSHCVSRFADVELLTHSFPLRATGPAGLCCYWVLIWCINAADYATHSPHLDYWVWLSLNLRWKQKSGTLQHSKVK